MKEIPTGLNAKNSGLCYGLMSEFSGVRLSISEFHELCRAEFSYLVSEHGFVEQALPGGPDENPFRLRFNGPAASVVIEGRSYGSGLDVVLERPTGESCRLVDILSLRAAGETGSLLQLGDQDALIRHAASMLSRHALDALRGDEEIFRTAGKCPGQAMEKPPG